MAGFQTPISISDALERIKRQEFLLPAFQREFEWGSKRIEMLFDSIMRGYPISSMLFWKVKDKTKDLFKFYRFLDLYIEDIHVHNEHSPTIGVNDFHAVLDGQQRLTALNIGLRGSFANKLKNKKRGIPQNYPTKKLYLNITKMNGVEENEKVYQFVFLNDSVTDSKILYLDSNSNIWFRVSEILNIHEHGDLMDFSMENNLERESRLILQRLYKVIFNERIINFYEEDSQEPDKAVDIFVRINSGGISLTFSNILMSIATASWKNQSARDVVNKLVDQVNRMGFRITKDYVLKTFLYLYLPDIRFKINSFKNDFSSKIENNWSRIELAIIEVFKLMRIYGLNEYSLTSYNATLPILYYIYHKNIIDFSTKIHYSEDRSLIRKWLLVVLLKRVFGSSADTVLSEARRGLTDTPGEINDCSSFPVSQINLSLAKYTSVSEAFLLSLLNMQKESQYSFALLSLLYPNLDYKNNDFHLDHIHPANKYKSLPLEISLSVPWAIYNSIVNLQMLDANENSSKSDKLLSEWIETYHSNDEAYLIKQLIPLSVSYEIDEIVQFLTARRKLLLNKLSELIGEINNNVDLVIEDVEFDEVDEFDENF